jgi:hypothetical protein
MNGATIYTGTFRTPYYTPANSNSYMIRVYDNQYNLKSAEFTITPTAGGNRAPRPAIRVSPIVAVPGEPVTLNASASYDYDNSYSTLTVEWDLNGDGVFDTVPTTTKTYIATFATAGKFPIRARITDPSGGQSISDRITLRIVDSIDPAQIWDPAIIWVNFAFFGLEDGTQFNPFNTLAEGAGRVVSSGTIRAVRGSSSEKVRITKPLRIEASGGPVRIGAQ